MYPSLSLIYQLENVMETRRPELTTLEIQGILNEECGWKVYQMDRLDSFQDSNYFVSYGISVGSHLKGDLQAMVRVIHRHLFKESEAETERKVMEQLHRDGFICTTCKPYSNKSWFYTTGACKSIKIVYRIYVIF